MIQHFEEQLFHTKCPIEAVVPTSLVNLKVFAVSVFEARVNELMCDCLWPEVDQFPMRQLCEKKIIEQLRAMLIKQSRDCLEFKNGSIGNEQVDELLFAVVMKCDFDSHFGPCPWQLGCDDRLINRLIKVRPQFVVN